ncbi:MAG TPA: iron-containing redox enzyme family protein [Polyangiaceae bacterium]|nr:iron-containing redox enzyme family protein [Polyangiaceae bacterium]
MLVASRIGGERRASHVERGIEKLSALCRAIGLEGKEAEVTGLFSAMIAPWGDTPVAPRADWFSDVCDDHTPYEFSFVLGEEPELRILVEALGDSPTLTSNWEAGRRLSAQLAKQYDITLDRLNAVEDLFAPAPGSKLAIWHAVSFFKNRAPEFKVYLDAQAQGLGRAGALLEQALARLGFDDAWTRVATAARRGVELDEFKYLSLDLAKSKTSRVKLYVRHRSASIADMETVLSETGAMPAGEASAFCRAMADANGPFVARPLFTCTTLVAGDKSARPRRTLYVPISAYVHDDAEAHRRIKKYLEPRGLPADSYDSAITSFAGRPLDAGVGLHSYVSLRYDSTRPRITFYLSPETYQIREPLKMESGTLPQAKDLGPLPAEEIVRRYEQDIVLADHPFFQRLGREPVRLPHLWLVMANFWEAIVNDFPSKLARAIANIENDEVKSVMVKQLNDELGEGDFSRAHKAMFRRLVAALEPHKMSGDDSKLMAPGRRFGQRLAEHMLSSDPWEAVGALMMVEVYGSQTDTRMGAEFRRQQELDPGALGWLHLHETLEVDHAGDSLKLAKLVPKGGPELESAWRGAAGVVAASEEYFDGLYALCFS